MKRRSVQLVEALISIAPPLKQDPQRTSTEAGMQID
jgi:hypothetical protein